MKYIALLRGINVSGHHLIKMDALKIAMAELPLQHITTYIQSGNLLFESDEDRNKLSKLIADKIYQRFGFDVAIMVLTPDDLRDAMAKNPFAKKTTDESVQPYVSFMSAIPEERGVNILKAVDFKGDEFIINGSTIYLWYADSAGNSKLSNAFIEKKLGIRSTMRNWKTIKKLIELSSAL